MNIIEKWKNFRFYCKVLDENREELREKFNIKIDSIYRMYTVYSIDQKTYDSYGSDIIAKKGDKNFSELIPKNNNILTDGDEYFKGIIKKELSKLNKYLNDKGLMELFGITSRQKLSKIDEKVVIEYKYIKTQFWANLALVSFLSFIIALFGGIVIAVILTYFL